MPTSILIDAESRIVSYVSGTVDWLDAETINLLEELLAR